MPTSSLSRNNNGRPYRRMVSIRRHVRRVLGECRRAERRAQRSCFILQQPPQPFLNAQTAMTLARPVREPFRLHHHASPSVISAPIRHQMPRSRVPRRRTCSKPSMSPSGQLLLVDPGRRREGGFRITAPRRMQRLTIFALDLARARRPSSQYLAANVYTAGYEFKLKLRSGDGPMVSTRRRHRRYAGNPGSTGSAQLTPDLAHHAHRSS